jgi:hypothetical protein
MKKGSTIFLKGVILLIAVVTLIGLIRFPLTEGRADNLDLISIYKDPLIIYIYIGSIPFFIGLYQAFKLLNFIEESRTFSKGAVNTLKNIRFAALSLICTITLALGYIRLFANGDDPAGPTALGIIVCFALVVIATGATVFQRILQNATHLKS